MKRKKTAMILCAALVLVLVLGVAAYARASAGSESDPLVTRSYLEEVFLPAVLEQVEAMAGGTSGSTDQGSFTVVTLYPGQVLTGEVGCELMLRIGTASATGADYPVLVDTSTGGELASGAALEKNHLNMITIAGNGILAGSSPTKVLVSGGYTIR